MTALAPKISVCICTYNRCRSLARTLESLEGQGGDAWSRAELIVIDNNCSDDTAGVVDQFAGRLPIRRVREGAQGLSHARNRALAEAQGDWVLFTDDDVVLDRGWLAAFLSAFDSHPEAGFAGGRVIPAWDGAPPRWFKGQHLDLIDGLLVWYDLGDETRAMTQDDPNPFGASFAIQRQRTAGLGGFRTDLGVNGRNAGRGEETEFVERARRQGENGVYVGEAVCHHYAEDHRFTPMALYRHGRAKARENLLTDRYSKDGSRLRAAGFLLRGLVQLAKGRGDRFRQCLVHVGIQHGLAAESHLASHGEAAQ